MKQNDSTRHITEHFCTQAPYCRVCYSARAYLRLMVAAGRYYVSNGCSFSDLQDSENSLKIDANTY